MGDCCEDELPLVLGSGREVHHHDRLAHVRFGIGWGAAQFGDPGLCECIPVRSVQLVPSLVDWHQGTSPLKAGATMVPDAGSHGRVFDRDRPTNSKMLSYHATRTHW